MDSESSTRLGVVAIFVENREQAAPKINQILSDFGSCIVGRMGIPYRERNISVMAIIVDGSNEEIGAMTGRLGAIPGVDVRVVLRRLR
ncbi:MAG: TM1266 family iron-only hydrogenase system putative regulator [candidate division WOR-3 bacterium]